MYLIRADFVVEVNTTFLLVRTIPQVAIDEHKIGNPGNIYGDFEHC